MSYACITNVKCSAGV